MGSGPSLGKLYDSHVSEINWHDSFGVAYSFLRKDIIPTYYNITGETYKNDKTFGANYHKKMFAPYRELYRNVLFFVNMKTFFRLAHPLFFPDIYPIEPKVFVYKEFGSIYFNENRDFCDEDFDKTLVYRNIMSFLIHFSVELDYKNIILLGVDLNTEGFFYDHYPEMEEYMINERKYYGRRRHSEKPDVREKKKFDTMYPKGNKIHTFDYYLYALADYLRRKRKINLYIGLKNNILYPSIPAYFN